jgi:hypothetical protein
MGIRIRAFLPDPDRNPLKMLSTYQKMDFLLQYFQFRYLNFSAYHGKTDNTFCHHCFKHLFLNYFQSPGELVILRSDPYPVKMDRIRQHWFIVNDAIQAGLVLLKYVLALPECVY